MTRKDDDAALDEIMKLIRKPAKDAKLTQAQYLLELVRGSLTVDKLPPSTDGKKVTGETGKG